MAGEYAFSPVTSSNNPLTATGGRLALVTPQMIHELRTGDGTAGQRHSALVNRGSGILRVIRVAGVIGLLGNFGLYRDGNPGRYQRQNTGNYTVLGTKVLTIHQPPPPAKV